MRINDGEIELVRLVEPGTSPNYNRNNPVSKVIGLVEGVDLAAERQHYLVDSLQYLFGVGRMFLYGPSGGDWQVRDPRLQDNKDDFQKQNVAGFTTAATQIIRGYANAGAWTGPVLQIAYTAALGSPLAGSDGVCRSPSLKLFLKVGAVEADGLISVPYNEATGRYEVELWGYPGEDLASHLSGKGLSSHRRGALLVRPDLVRGALEDFQGPGFDKVRDDAGLSGVAMFDYLPDHAMHPVRPLRVEFAWADEAGERWDSRDGKNYVYEFAMSFRGWANYVGIGPSSNPHGGLGRLEYRNLYSNYFGHEARRREALGPSWRRELGRDLDAWNFDADRNKPPAVASEPFMAVDYMDLHVLEPGCSIGIHRHRDNQEVFLLLNGKALMITGDWAEYDGRQRAIEVRTMRAGELALVKGGQMHALVNSLDEPCSLFMFGGYD
ncbi:cupin domain-containing protein (plasmid) [Azospirillum sp. A26]|uniref:cupin domain-containing protein n=1 Tax=Azospirillum sp. A26 TaxID=3160607 RepID=UPI00367055AC